MAKSQSRKVAKRNVKASLPESVEIAREIQRLASFGREAYPSELHVEQGNKYAHCWLDTQYRSEAAEIMEIRAGRGTVAEQLISELNRVRDYYSNLLARVQARVWADDIEARVANKRKAAS